MFDGCVKWIERGGGDGGQGGSDERGEVVGGRSDMSVRQRRWRGGVRSEEDVKSTSESTEGERGLSQKGSGRYTWSAWGRSEVSNEQG